MGIYLINRTESTRAEFSYIPEVAVIVSHIGGITFSHHQNCLLFSRVMLFECSAALREWLRQREQALAMSPECELF